MISERPTPVQELGDARQGEVVGDRQVVDQGQGQDGVDRAAVRSEARSRFCQPVPGLGLIRSSSRGRIRRLAAPDDLAVVQLDAARVDVERDRRDPPRGGDPAEPAGVGAEVPDRRRPDPVEVLARRPAPSAPSAASV